MTTHASRSIIALALVMLGCAYTPPAIPVLAPVAAQVEPLVGKWLGDYETASIDRAGTIAFTLAPGADTAYGEVVMIPRSFEPPNRPDITGTMRTAGSARMPVGLEVRFVRIRDGHVTGELQPYVDPDFGCLVLTTFTGSLRDSVTLAGRFVTKDQNGYVMQRGEWQVRKAAP